MPWPDCFTLEELLRMGIGRHETRYLRHETTQAQNFPKSCTLEICAASFIFKALGIMAKAFLVVVWLDLGLGRVLAVAVQEPAHNVSFLDYPSGWDEPNYWGRMASNAD